MTPCLQHPAAKVALDSCCDKPSQPHAEGQVAGFGQARLQVLMRLIECSVRLSLCSRGQANRG